MLLAFAPMNVRERPSGVRDFSECVCMECKHRCELQYCRRRVAEGLNPPFSLVSSRLLTVKRLGEKNPSRIQNFYYPWPIRNWVSDLQSIRNSYSKWTTKYCRKKRARPWNMRDEVDCILIRDSLWLVLISVSDALLHVSISKVLTLVPPPNFSISKVLTLVPSPQPTCSLSHPSTVCSFPLLLVMVLLLLPPPSSSCNSFPIYYSYFSSSPLVLCPDLPCPALLLVRPSVCLSQLLCCILFSD